MYFYYFLQSFDSSSFFLERLFRWLPLVAHTDIRKNCRRTVLYIGLFPKTCSRYIFDKSIENVLRELDEKILWNPVEK